MASFSFPSAERLVPRYSQVTSGPQQRIYTRPVWDAIPLPLFGPLGEGLFNDNGLLVLTGVPVGWPESATGLPPGAVWNNSTFVTVVPGGVPPPGYPPLFYGDVSAEELLALGGSGLPTSDPRQLNRIWNNNGAASVSFGTANVFILGAFNQDVLGSNELA